MNKTQISDEMTVNKQLKYLMDFNSGYMFDFLFTDLLVSHENLHVRDSQLFFFRERPNPMKVKIKEEDLDEEELPYSGSGKQRGSVANETQVAEGKTLQDSLEDFSDDDDDNENRPRVLSKSLFWIILLIIIIYYCLSLLL